MDFPESFALPLEESLEFNLNKYGRLHSVYLVLKSLGSLLFSFNEQDGINPMNQQTAKKLKRANLHGGTDPGNANNSLRQMQPCFLKALSTSESELVIKDGGRLNICS